MPTERLSLFTNEIVDKLTCNIESRHLYKRIHFNPGLGLQMMVAGSESKQLEDLRWQYLFAMLCYVLMFISNIVWINGSN